MSETNSSRNATKHGLSCETFFLIPGETQEEFDALAQSLTDEYKDVASPGLTPLLETLVHALWLQKRAYKKVFESENALAMAEMSRESSEVTEKIFRRLLLMQRYKTSYENSYQRALRAIEAYRKSRIASFVTQVRIEQMTYSIAELRVKSYDRFVNHCGHSHEKALEMVNKFYTTLPNLPQWSPQKNEPEA